MAFDYTIIPDHLIKAINNNNAIAFCGAGLSISAKRTNGKNLPNWPNLLHEILKYALNDGIKFSGYENEIITAIDNNQLLMVAQEFQEVVPHSNLNRYLRNIFLDKNLVPSIAHTNLMRIPFLGYLTTNYDTLLEGAYTIEKRGRMPPVYTQEDLLSVPNPLRISDDFVFKIHGDINRPETIILSSHDYKEILFRTPHYRSFLETLFTINTVLFIGFGLQDPDTDFILDRLSGIYARNNEYHYALVEEGKFSNFEKKRLAIDKRILVIEYKNDDKMHSQVNDFLSHLAEITASDGKLRTEYKTKTESLPKKEKHPKNHSVFISYSYEDKEQADYIANYLINNDIDVWYDKLTISVGDSIVSKIEEGITKSDYILFLLSKNSMERKWVQKEIQMGLAKSISDKSTRIIPVLIGDVNPRKMPIYLVDRHWLDLRDEIDKNLNKLIKQIKE
jgi:SIR2-like protein/TIR domain-containing protein